MKTLLLIVTVAIFCFSCKKEKTMSKTELLTAKTWLYDEYYTNYNQPNAELVYKRGRENNTMDLSQNRIKFNTDGTYMEINEAGTSLAGTWRFINNETQTEVVNSLGTFTTNVVSLSSNVYAWHDSVSGRYGKLIPQ